MNRTNMDTALRLLETVRCMQLGRWCTTAQVYERLQERGFQVSRRTVERDLLKLARPFGLDCAGSGIEGDLSYRWRRTRSLEDAG